METSDIFLRDREQYRHSLAAGMEFLAGAVIRDPADPDYQGILHMYNTELGGWNRPYMELAGQATRNALLPYADYTGDERWLDLASAIIANGVLARAACEDSHSPAFGLLCNCADLLCDYGSPLDRDDMADMVRYRRDRKGFLGRHPTTPRKGRMWFTFDTAEVLMAAVLLQERRHDSALEQHISRMTERLFSLVDENGEVPQYYDDADGAWHGKPELTTNSRLLWIYGLLRQSGTARLLPAMADRIAECLLRRQLPNGMITASGADAPVVAEIVIYEIEGLYHGGVLLKRPELVQAALRSFDALLCAPHILASSPYAFYYPDWRPVAPYTERGPAGVPQELNHMSVTGQVAQLAWQFWHDTGEARFLDVYRRGIDLLFCLQDRRSAEPARGGIPRSPSMPWWREICPVYTYAGALIPGLRRHNAFSRA